MGRRSKGYRSQSRSLMRKPPRQRGKIGLGRILKQYKPGERVTVIIDPSMHKGMPHRRYHGRIGVIHSRRGRSYIISVEVGKQKKQVVARPEHIRPAL